MPAAPDPVGSTLALVLRVSRPYYYLVTLWIYLMPTGGRFELFGSPTFWLGVAYCTLPLNLLCYLMNDLADVAIDADNPRKGGPLLGAKETAARLRAAAPIAAALQLPFLVAFATREGQISFDHLFHLGDIVLQLVDLRRLAKHSELQLHAGQWGSKVVTDA